MTDTQAEQITGWSSPTIGKLADALAKSQAAFGVIARTREVVVRTKTGGTYKFSYAPLDEILAQTRPLLAKNGLAIVQTLAEPNTMRTMLLHSSGEWIASDMAFVRSAEIQQLGSTLTYIRRYCLVAMLGVASEEDDDGNAASGNEYHDEPRHQPPPQTKAPPAAKPQQAKPVQTVIETTAEVRQANDGMPSDLAAVLKDIAGAKDVMVLFSLAERIGALEESIRGNATVAFNDRLRALKA